ncbi:DUF4386 domain-containing protein, partial [Nostoc sp. CHAB 5834]|nr:DUF4386 domain-containing protein [Nostoc sp. CHAB 5834]
VSLVSRRQPIKPMKPSVLPAGKLIGNLLILGVVLVMIPYTTLTMLFDYPAILRQDSGDVLIRFRAGGHTLIAVWWLFAVGGFPLMQAYVLIGQKFEPQDPVVRWATTLGVVSAITQIVGLLRWTFVVPVLATQYVNATDGATRQAVVVVFDAIHQYGGVVLGEHLGQLLTIAYMVLMTGAFARLRLFPRWVNYLGYGASAIYLLAQGELVATVMPGFPNWGLAGLLGSTLWLGWLVVIGLRFRRLAG